MQRRTVGLIAGGLLVIGLAVIGASVALAQVPPFQGSSTPGLGGMMGGWSQGVTRTVPYGHGGMMGGGGPGVGPSTGITRTMPFGPGGMMGGGMMGGGMMGGGMMGGWGQSSPTGQAITLDQAHKNVQAYLDRLGNPDLAIDEVLAFQNDFYAFVKEKSTGTGAFELLVNKFTGAVFPEYGPNTMWNTRYGMMGQNPWMAQMMGYQQPTGPMTITLDQARQTAQQWLEQNQPGTTIETPHVFAGYYTLHTLKDGKVTGMLSVNGYSGQVWYHTWHGGPATTTGTAL